MADMWMDVDAALAEVPVNLMPLIDDTDFKTIEDAVAYNAAGMDLRWNFVTCAGSLTSTAVTPTTGGDYDWTHQGDGIYTIEIPSSGGASINNDTEGFGWFSGKATGVLPWRGPVIGFRRAALNDMFIDGGTASTNFEDMFDGTGYAGGTTKLAADVSNLTAVADSVLTRNVSNVEATADEHTLCTVVLAMLENSISGTTLTIKRTNGSTTHYTKTLTTNVSAEPITGIT